MNFKLLIGRGEASERGRCYRGFLLGILAYYVFDGAWGIIAGLGWTGFLYFETIFFFLSLVAFFFMWGRFVIAYLDSSKRLARIISFAGYGILIFNLVALVTNPFNKCFYYFDSHFGASPFADQRCSGYEPHRIRQNDPAREGGVFG